MTSKMKVGRVLSTLLTFLLSTLFAAASTTFKAENDQYLLTFYVLGGEHAVCADFALQGRDGYQAVADTVEHCYDNSNYLGRTASGEGRGKWTLPTAYGNPESGIVLALDQVRRRAFVVRWPGDSGIVLIPLF